MTTKGQMKPTSCQGEFNGVPGRREQPKQWPRPYSCIQYSIRPDLQKKSLTKTRRRAVLSEPSAKPAKKRTDRAKRFQIQNRQIDSINSNINLDLGFSDIKDRLTVPNPLNPTIKIFAEKWMNQSASNWNIENTIKMPTNWSNNDPNDTVQLRDFLEK